MTHIRANNSKLSGLLCLILGITFASPARALFDVQAHVGSRSGTWSQDETSKSVAATTLKLSTHLDPIPLVPVGFGLALYSEQWKVSPEDHGLKRLSSYSVVPEITGWLPLDSFRPFARLGYSVLSAYTGKVSTGAGTASAVEGTLYLAGSGIHAAVGVEWSVPAVPLLSLSGEFEYAQETLKLAKNTVGGTDISGSYKSPKISSTAILVGAKIGF